MSAAAATGERSRTDGLARLSPLILLAVAMPWLLEWSIVAAVARLAPAHEPLVTRLADGFLYPIVTGSVVLTGLYALLDPNARRSLFLFRRPSRRELLAAVAAVPAVALLQQVVGLAVVSLFDLEFGSTLGAEFELAFLLRFLVVGCVFAPVVEEVLFRGLLLEYLVERGVPTLAAAGVVVAAFAAIHHYGGPVHMALAATMGAVAVALRLRYDNLVSPIVFHSLLNLNNVLLQLFLWT